MAVTSQRRYAPRSVCHNADMQHALYVTKKYTPCSISHQKIYTMLYMSQKGCRCNPNPDHEHKQLPIVADRDCDTKGMVQLL